MVVDGFSITETTSLKAVMDKAQAVLNQRGRARNEETVTLMRQFQSLALYPAMQSLLAEGAVSAFDVMLIARDLASQQQVRADTGSAVGLRDIHALLDDPRTASMLTKQVRPSHLYALAALSEPQMALVRDFQVSVRNAGTISSNDAARIGSQLELLAARANVPRNWHMNPATLDALTQPATVALMLRKIPRNRLADIYRDAGPTRSASIFTLTTQLSQMQSDGLLKHSTQIRHLLDEAAELTDDELKRFVTGSALLTNRTIPMDERESLAKPFVEALSEAFGMRLEPTRRGQSGPDTARAR